MNVNITPWDVVRVVAYEGGDWFVDEENDFEKR
jgi:hypothetical protein